MPSASYPWKKPSDYSRCCTSSTMHSSSSSSQIWASLTGPRRSGCNNGHSSYCKIATRQLVVQMVLAWPQSLIETSTGRPRSPSTTIDRLSRGALRGWGQEGPGGGSDSAQRGAGRWLLKTWRQPAGGGLINSLGSFAKASGGSLGTARKERYTMEN